MTRHRLFPNRLFPLPPPARAFAPGGPSLAAEFRVGRQDWRRLALAVAFMLLGFGGWQLGAAGYIHAKAWLAQVLLSQAWAETLESTAEGESAAPQKPWPWADTGPVARLQVPELGVDQIVLAGASGRSLAFGPGHLDQTAAPGTAGHSVISGHRDTHFAFLRDLAPDSKLRVQRADGGWRSYRVRGGEVVDARKARLTLAVDRPALTLVTCWPFDSAEPGGPLRYAVTAEVAEDYVPPVP